MRFSLRKKEEPPWRASADSRLRKKAMLTSVKPTLLLELFLVCALSAATGEAQTLKVPYAALSPNYSPLWIAQQGGYFKKYQLDVQPIYITSGSVVLPALLSGQVEIANLSAGPALTAWARGAEMVTIGVVTNQIGRASC